MLLIYQKEALDLLSKADFQDHKFVYGSEVNDLIDNSSNNKYLVETPIFVINSANGSDAITLINAIEKPNRLRNYLNKVGQYIETFPKKDITLIEDKVAKLHSDYPEPKDRIKETIKFFNELRFVTYKLEADESSNINYVIDHYKAQQKLYRYYYRFNYLFESDLEPEEQFDLFAISLEDPAFLNNFWALDGFDEIDNMIMVINKNFDQENPAAIYLAYFTYQKGNNTHKSLCIYNCEKKLNGVGEITVIYPFDIQSKITQEQTTDIHILGQVIHIRSSNELFVRSDDLLSISINDMFLPASKELQAELEADSIVYDKFIKDFKLSADISSVDDESSYDEKEYVIEFKEENDEEDDDEDQLNDLNQKK